MELLLKEYKESLKAAKKLRKEAPEEDEKIYAGMISSLEYAVKWLRDGHRPLPKKSSRAYFKEAETIERIRGVDLFNPFAKDPYTLVENMIDAERESQ